MTFLAHDLQVAFDAGARARRNDQVFFACPYFNPALQLQWRRGWLAQDLGRIDEWSPTKALREPY